MLDWSAVRLKGLRFVYRSSEKINILLSVSKKEKYRPVKAN